MGPARRVGQAFSPLDEELELDSNGLTPHGQEALVRLSVWMPFERACELLKDLLGIVVSVTSARGYTYHTGQAALAVEQAEEQRICQELPEAPKGADKQVISPDGAFVPLVGGEWREVKTLILGEVGQTQDAQITTEHISSFSRLADAQTFTRAALVEVHRRGLEGAKEVCAVMDGAEWIQGVIDHHRSDALRILDFAHAAEYVSGIGEAVRASGRRLPGNWLEGVLHRLKHEGPDRVLVHLLRLCQRCKDPEAHKKLQYLSLRISFMQYPTYQQAGWPIGSGMVESANKLVVEARLKGAGMHWQLEHVNPMLVLRNAVCNGRWHETWQASRTQLRQERTQRRQQHAELRLHQACWQLLVLWTQMHRPSTPAPAPLPFPTHSRPASGYSWHKPFLRSPPSHSPATGAIYAKI